MDGGLLIINSKRTPVHYSSLHYIYLSLKMTVIRVDGTSPSYWKMVSVYYVDYRVLSWSPYAILVCHVDLQWQLSNDYLLGKQT